MCSEITRQNTPASGGADRLALEHHRGVAVDQRRVADVAVADDPAHVRGGPEHVARIEVVDVLHAPVQGHQMPGSRAHHALGCAGRAGGVEDVGGVIALHRHALCGRSSLLEGVPFMVAPLDQRRGLLLALQDHAEFRLVRGEIDGPVEQGLVGEHPPGLEAAGGGDHRLGAGVVDAHGKLVGGESAEHHRVDRPEPGAGEHRGERLGHHRHVDDHPVALLNAAIAQRARKPGDALEQFGIGDLALRIGDGAVMDDRDLIAAPGLDMPVEGVPACVDLAVAEPLIEGGVAVEEGLARLLDPVNGLGRLHPEPFRILLPALIDLPVPHGACPPHRSRRGAGHNTPDRGGGFPGRPACWQAAPLKPGAYRRRRWSAKRTEPAGGGDSRHCAWVLVRNDARSLKTTESAPVARDDLEYPFCTGQMGRRI